MTASMKYSLNLRPAGLPEPAKGTVKKSPPGAKTNLKNCLPKAFLKRGLNSISSYCRTIYAPRALSKKKKRLISQQLMEPKSLV